MPAGRPSDYTDELAVEICQRLADGQSLVTICEDDHIPQRDTIRRWCRDNAEFSAMYTQARLDAADSFSDLMAHIVEKEENPNMINAKVNAYATIQARQAPRKYGTQRIGVGQDSEAGPMEIKVIYAEADKPKTDQEA